MLFHGDWVGLLYVLGTLLFAALLERERRAGKRLREREEEGMEKLE